MQMPFASLLFSIPMVSQPRRPGGAGISDKKDHEDCGVRGTGDDEGPWAWWVIFEVVE
jgi:hypothetical protein